MAKVFIHTTMSLDGFLAGLHDEVDWSFRFGSDRMAEHSLQEIGAVVLGNRKIYRDKDTVPYGGMVKVPHFVITHKLQDPQTVSGLTFTFVGGIPAALEQAKAAAGEKNVAILGASISQQCLRAGLVDEILMHLAPILLGEGIRLFDHLGNAVIELERTEIESTAQITSLRFRVVK